MTAAIPAAMSPVGTGSTCASTATAVEGTAASGEMSTSGRKSPDPTEADPTEPPKAEDAEDPTSAVAVDPEKGACFDPIGVDAAVRTAAFRRVRSIMSPRTVESDS